MKLCNILYSVYLKHQFRKFKINNNQVLGVVCVCVCVSPPRYPETRFLCVALAVMELTL